MWIEILSSRCAVILLQNCYEHGVGGYCCAVVASGGWWLSVVVVVGVSGGGGSGSDGGGSDGDGGGGVIDESDQCEVYTRGATARISIPESV
jgi:hypothetical protein